MAKPRNVIQLSFRNEGDEYELFTFLKSKLNASAFIKETLWDLYKGNQVSLGTPFVFAPPKTDVASIIGAPQDAFISDQSSVTNAHESKEEDLFEESEDRDVEW